MYVYTHIHASSLVDKVLSKQIGTIPLLCSESSCSLKEDTVGITQLLDQGMPTDSSTNPGNQINIPWMVKTAHAVFPKKTYVQIYLQTQTNLQYLTSNIMSRYCNSLTT